MKIYYSISISLGTLCMLHKFCEDLLIFMGIYLFMQQACVYSKDIFKIIDY